MSEVLIVTGPAGAGKSTACQEFAETAAGTWAYIAQDQVRQQVKAGCRSPAEEWDDATRLQWDVSHRISADIMKQYQASDINCIVDGFSPDLKASYENWPEYLEGIDYTLAVILPSLETTLQRNRKRNGDARLKDFQVENLHGWYLDFIKASGAMVIDSTKLSVKDVVEELKDICS